MPGYAYPGLGTFSGQQAEAIRMLWDAIHTLREGTKTLEVLTPTVAAQSYSPSVMQTELSGHGNYPLNVAGLLGVLADPQRMSMTVIPSTSSLPAGALLAGYNSYEIVAWKGKLYYLDPSTNPPQWVSPMLPLTVLSKTSAYVVKVTDGDHVVILCTGTFPVLLYPASGNSGKVVEVKNVSTGLITVDGAGAETLDGSPTTTIGIQNASLTFVCTGSGWAILYNPNVLSTIPACGPTPVTLTALQSVRNNAAGTGLEAYTPVSAAVAIYTAALADVANTVSETTALSFVVPANAWADGDVIQVLTINLNKNNKGTNGTTLFKVNVGAGAQVTIRSMDFIDSASEYKVLNGFGLMRNGTGVEVIVSIGAASYSSDQTNITLGGTSTPTNFTSDITVSLKVTHDAAHATYYHKPRAAKVIHYKS